MKPAPTEALNSAGSGVTVLDWRKDLVPSMYMYERMTCSAPNWRRYIQCGLEASTDANGSGVASCTSTVRHTSSPTCPPKIRFASHSPGVLRAVRNNTLSGRRPCLQLAPALYTCLVLAPLQVQTSNPNHKLNGPVESLVSCCSVPALRVGHVV